MFLILMSASILVKTMKKNKSKVIKDG